MENEETGDLCNEMEKVLNESAAPVSINNGASFGLLSNTSSMEHSFKNSLCSTVTSSNSDKFSISSKTSDGWSRLCETMSFERKQSDFRPIEYVKRISLDNPDSTKSSLSLASSADGDRNGLTSGTINKPHKSNDLRWESIRTAMSKYGNLSLNHFRLLKKLGFGDIGSVYLAQLRGTNSLFAAKVMDRSSLAGRKKLLRAQTERDILSVLDHPFLPTLYTHFETEKFSCLIMEFCSGGDLHMLRQRQTGKCFSEQAARFYASEVLLALEYLHMMGVVYRDLKPENVLVREDGHIMLSDFDLSMRCYVNPTLVKSSSFSFDPSCKLSSYCVEPSCIGQSYKSEPFSEPSCLQPSCFTTAYFRKSRMSKNEATIPNRYHSLPELVAEPTNARSMSFVGTHEYLAPEIIKGDGHGSAVDWWTFGIFLYELLYGRTPFKGSNNRETLFNVVGQSIKFPESPCVSSSAKDIIRGLLVKDPKQRLAYKRGATEIKQHPFFENVSWALIRSTSPPDIPKPVDLTFFNPTNGSSGYHHDGSMNVTDHSSSSYLDFDFSSLCLYDDVFICLSFTFFFNLMFFYDGCFFSSRKAAD